MFNDQLRVEQKSVMKVNLFHLQSQQITIYRVLKQYIFIWTYNSAGTEHVTYSPKVYMWGAKC